MRNKIYAIALSLLLISCQPRSLSESKRLGIAIQQELLSELREIHTIQDLQSKEHKLQRLHIEIAHVIKHARSLQKKGFKPASFDSFTTSNELRDEIIRICSLPGGRQIFEKIQEEALYIFDHID